MEAMSLLFFARQALVVLVSRKEVLRYSNSFLQRNLRQSISYILFTATRDYNQ
jgi:hypothetical protein